MLSLAEFPNFVLRNFIDARFLWTPVVLGFFFFVLWMKYIRIKFIRNIEWVLLEIKLPREIPKSPKAVEMIFNTLHQTSKGSPWDRYIKGKAMAWFSLEIVSLGGQIRFYVNIQKNFRNLAEAQIYGQFPDAEIAEVDDYAKTSFTEGFGKEWNCWGTEFAFTQPDVYPIKTYIDYGLHEMMTKEEQKVDPMTSFLESIGSIKQGEQIWMQILARAAFNEKGWKKAGEAKVKEIMEAKKEKTMGMVNLTPGDKVLVEAIERDISKMSFDVGMRAIYFAPKDRFNRVNISAIVSSMKQYNSLNLNGFRPNNSTSVDYPLDIFDNPLKTAIENSKKRKMIDAYRQRSYFYMPYARNPLVMNTEELATIFHFPGRVAETPTFGRIEAKKSEPPSNLPV